MRKQTQHFNNLTDYNNVHFQLNATVLATIGANVMELAPLCKKYYIHKPEEFKFCEHSTFVTKEHKVTVLAELKAWVDDLLARGIIGEEPLNKEEPAQAL